MALTPGTWLGPYKITALLGSGGTGEVYRARDTKLQRDVALKVLREDVRLDEFRLRRFEHEARVLASLNHSNIAAIYGFEEGTRHASGRPIQALVLELVDGETLASRLIRGPVRVPEALTFARQIAEALDTAHGKGIVHRDLKPSNIAITPTGVVKVLDFGLAKITGPAETDIDRTQTARATREGMVVGTSAYMSPEQARGQVLDKRTDIWAFGCVLYEMLTGRAAFARNTVTDTLAAVVEGEPDFAALPTQTPPAVRRLLQRCLRKDPYQRLRDVADARIEIEDGLVARATAEAGDRPRAGRRVTAAAILGGLAVATAAGAIWIADAREQTPAREVIRTAIILPGAQQMDLRGRNAPLALSPDGRRLVYSARAEGRVQLYLRNLDSFEGQPIAGSEGAYNPFFSPDGRWIAFFANGKLLRISSNGGAPIPVCDVSASTGTNSVADQPFTFRPPGAGGTWGPDDTIVFPGTSGLLRVNASGGTPVPLVSADREIDEATHAWPRFLPDGRGLLSTVGGNIALLTLATGQWRILGPGSQARFLSPDYLLFHGERALGEGELFALPFDSKQLEPRGDPISVLSSVFRGRDSGAAYFASSQTGTLVFAPGGLHHTLVQVDRQGRRTPMLSEHQGYRMPRFSPDGKRVALSILPRPNFVWIYDLDRRAGIQVTARGSCCPIWTPDGKRLTYQSGREVNWRAADLSSPEESLFADGSYAVQDWSRDGQTLLITHQHSTTGWDLSVVERGGEPRAIVATPETEVAARFSPDGLWIAYMSCAFAGCDVHVRPFPDVDASLTTVSTAGGGSPVWAPDGRELFYMQGPTMMAVPIEVRDGALVAGTPTRLFDGPFDTSQVRNYDISPDGTTFVMVESDPDASPTYFQIVQNWGVELRRLVATNSD